MFFARSNLLFLLFQYLALVQLFKMGLESVILFEMVECNTPFLPNIAKQKDLLIL